MRQDFSDVTEEKLSSLFPIILRPYDTAWAEYYLTEKEFLKSVFGEYILRINHIGSTSVPGIIAKPTVDILLEIAQNTDLPSITERMKEEGYMINTPQKDIIMYLKGYTPRGFEGQCVHIHVRYSGDWDELYFRYYLILHPKVAKEYENIKLLLQKEYTHDRDGYTEAKGEFVRKFTDLARVEFPDRYIPVTGEVVRKP